MRKTAIEEIFLHNSEIMESIHPNRNYLKLQDEGYVVYQKLVETLNEKQAEYLTALLDAEMGKEAEAVDEYFVKGLKYGMRLACECLLQ